MSAPHRRRRIAAWALSLAAVAAAGALGVLAATRAGGDDETQREPAGTRTPLQSTTGARPTPRRPPLRAEPEPWLDRALLARRVSAVAAATGAEVGVAVSGGGAGLPATAGPLQTAPAWSTIKVPLVLARYALAEERGEATGRIDGLAAAALTASDNEAAAALFDDLVAATGSVETASRSVQAVLATAGDRRTTVNAAPIRPEFSTYGQTQWALSDGTVFLAALGAGCVGPPHATERVSRLLGEVVPDQRWGLGRAAFTGASETLLKGGWGPDEDGRYLVRQFGIVRGTSGRFVAVGLMARPSSGSFEAGVAALDRLAEIVAATVRLERVPAPRRCVAPR